MDSAARDSTAATGSASISTPRSSRRSRSSPSHARAEFSFRSTAFSFPDQAAHIARDCRMRAIITTAAKLTALAPVLASISVARVSRLSWGPTLRCRDQAFRSTASRHCAKVRSRRRAARTSIEKDLAAILYTSGFDGEAQGRHAEPRAGHGGELHRLHLSWRSPTRSEFWRYCRSASTPASTRS